MDNPAVRGASVSIGSCRYDPSRAELLGCDGAPVHLRAQAMRLLDALCARAGEVVKRDELLAAVWPGVVVTDDSLVQCIRDIRRALGDDQYRLRTVRGIGYRLDLDASPARATDVGPPAPAAASAGTRLGRRAVHTVLAAVLLLATVVALIVGVRWPGGPEPASGVLVRYRAPAAPGVAGDADAAFTAGLAEQLVLDIMRNLPLRAAAMAAAGDQADSDGPLHQARARWDLDATVQAHANGLRLSLSLSLSDGAGGRSLWAERSDLTLVRLSAERAALLRRLSRSVDVALMQGERAPILPPPPKSLEAHRLVHRALGRIARFERDDVRSARDELRQAIEREPGFAQAWGVLAFLDAVDAGAFISGSLPVDHAARALSEADRALALDPQSALARQARSFALASTGSGAKAVHDARLAIEQSPFDAQGFVALANALASIGSMAEALDAIDQAKSRYLLRPPALFDFVRAKVLWGNDRFDDAVAAASRCLERAPHLVGCRAVRAIAGDSMGRLEAAREDLKIYRATVPGPSVHEFGPGSYGVPKLKNDWLAQVRREIGLP